ncbi:MAG: MBL fold metallo-hydrolase [Saccharospirillum sp.]
MEPIIRHHGAVTGVTGSCHQYCTQSANLLIDCGLFQGDEADRALNEFGFDVSAVTGLIVTHCHIDHVGRIPWLIASGFNGPIWCTEPTAALLPLVLEDALGIHIPDDQALVQRALARIVSQIEAVPFAQWHQHAALGDVQLRFQPAGHIMGSAYVELDNAGHRTVFSGDLGAPGAIFVEPPKAPERADVIVLESTYGDRNHEQREIRKQHLAQTIERSLKDGGTILIPAFSLGRTQEILAIIEELLSDHSFSLGERVGVRGKAKVEGFPNLPIILDSPLAARLTTAYRNLVEHWREPMRERRENGRMPLGFDQLITVQSHSEHVRLVQRLKQTGQPAIVLAASGMCQGGRIVNYLQALLSEPETDVVFLGYQARGTLGRRIQTAGQGRWLKVAGERVQMNARIHRLSGFSAHADQQGLLSFCTDMAQPPADIRLVHGDQGAKQTLQKTFQSKLPQAKIIIPTQ